MPKTEKRFDVKIHFFNTDFVETLDNVAITCKEDVNFWARDYALRNYAGLRVKEISIIEREVTV